MSRSIRRRALLAAALPVALAAFALPSAANAGTIGFAGGTLGYTDTKAENNNVVVRAVGNEILITDSVPITAAGHCQVVNQTQAFCPATASAVHVATLHGNDTVDYRLPHRGGVSLGDGNDRLIAGQREAIGRPIRAVGYFPGTGSDRIDYSVADRGVKLTPEDGLSNDGRPGDLDNVAPGFDVITGSHFDDTLFGSDLPEIFFPLNGNDFVAGGHGNDLFTSYNARDGADDFHGGPGYDAIDYFGRLQPLHVKLDNLANDGESGEGDNVRTNVENLYGGEAADQFESSGAFSRLEGRGGNDRLFGEGGPDTLIGGPGRDLLNAGSGSDVVDARDGGLDDIDCGTQTDSFMRDSREGKILGCEGFTVGKLRLTPESARAATDETARLKLSWRHPKAWKQLRTVELRLTRDGVPVGSITIRARDKRITGTGAVEAVRRRSRIAAEGKTVTARLAVRLDDSVAGDTLKAEVEATDTRGRRQLERDAATIRVAG